MTKDSEFPRKRKAPDFDRPEGRFRYWEMDRYICIRTYKRTEHLLWRGKKQWEVLLLILWAADIQRETCIVVKREEGSILLLLQVTSSLITEGLEEIDFHLHLTMLILTCLEDLGYLQRESLNAKTDPMKQHMRGMFPFPSNSHGHRDMYESSTLFVGSMPSDVTERVGLDCFGNFKISSRRCLSSFDSWLVARVWGLSRGKTDLLSALWILSIHLVRV